ncbi:enoyl-CoA hydratase/isomerase family protein [Thalassobacillus devorans]|nr:enoyl-CoA hydratase-related protein [Thalassobacillus devorans]
MNLIQYSCGGEIAKVTIHNPPLNVLTDELLTELDKAVSDILQEESTRAMILTGTGKKAFVAGADINQFSVLTKETGKELVDKGKRIFNKIANAKFPVICAMNGLTLGGGLELALACDIRIAEENVKMGLPETGLGILPGYAGTQRLTRLIGPGKAKQMIFTGVTFSAVEAHQVGLIEKIVPNGEAYIEGMKIAEQILMKGPVAIACAKNAIDNGIDMPLADGQRLESDYFGELCETEDMQEGVKAFKEKRKPTFLGK